MPNFVGPSKKAFPLPPQADKMAPGAATRPAARLDRLPMQTSPTGGASLPPLAGIRILDFTRVLAGPWCTLNLADLGAAILKVENPEGGDDTRSFRPPEVAGESAYFLFANRNKRSIAIDLAAPEGRELVRDLARQVDVVVENFRPDVMARHGLDYAALAQVNPRLIYCSISGYGHDSPLKLVAGYDPVAQGESGMMSVTGEPEGEPMRTGVAYADIFTGMFAAQAILAALRVRDRDGKGQFIDMALLDCAVAVTANLAQNWFVSGREPQRLGNRHPFLEPFGTFETADGLITIVIGNARQWERMCRDVLGRPDLLEDPRFAVNDARLAHRQETRDLLTAIFRQDTRDNWIDRMRKAGVPAGSVRSVGEALQAPEVLHRGMVDRVEHPRAGEVRVVASPIRMSESPVGPPAPAPLLGEHTDAILREFGLDAEAIARLRAAGAVR